MLEAEKEKGRVLQDALKVLAEEHHGLQTSLQRRVRRCSTPRGTMSDTEAKAGDADGMVNNNNAENSSVSDSGSDVDEFYECNADEGKWVRKKLRLFFFIAAQIAQVTGLI